MQRKEVSELQLTIETNEISKGTPTTKRRNVVENADYIRVKLHSSRDEPSSGVARSGFVIYSSSRRVFALQLFEYTNAH
jgi:hypothetical protein